MIGGPVATGTTHHYTTTMSDGERGRTAKIGEGRRTGSCALQVRLSRTSSAWSVFCITSSCSLRRLGKCLRTFLKIGPCKEKSSSGAFDIVLLLLWAGVDEVHSQYSARYRPELDLVLKDLNVKIVSTCKLHCNVMESHNGHTERAREDRYRWQDGVWEVYCE